MSREYEVFVESLRQSLMERLGLNEKQIYFEERDENGMTPNGDWNRLQKQWKVKYVN